jgi:molecular chaperone GrpE
MGTQHGDEQPSAEEQKKQENEHEKTEHADLENLKKECEEYKAGWQRAQADYQNLQREVEKKRSEWIVLSEMQILEECIPVYDHFKKAFGSSPETQNNEQASWIKGIEMIMKQFGDILKRHGVEEMKTLGETFSPELHEAVGEEISDEEEGVIIQEMESGYMMKERVVKPAKVIVAKKAE